MRVANLSFRYGRRAPWVLSGAELSLAEGDVVEVVGPNGTGKSTLLRLLAGLLRPVRGAIEDRPPVVGYAPERFPADQPFTVSSYLRHMAAVRRADPAVVGEWSERLGMAHLLDQRLPDLSKGSAHKVGLAQALLCRPGLLILDEPFAGLDTATRAELPRVVGEVSARGGIVVVSDHQGDLRAFPGLRRCEVRDGAVRALDSTDSTRVETLVGSPGASSGGASPAGAGRAVSSTVRAAVLRVEVPAAEATGLADRLRAEGYRVDMDSGGPANQDTPLPEAAE
ncbi:ATP-binding cassette domain-containing protein [Microbispora sp. RL4-1S]|uniref:ATP-binding cassette domain-containing protein n=1 Tax=Microbispora oryzae TaxID=2806554 RepID=A0A940WGX8_9ACTN|nr:ATP-binding cassette domain-containing protein [Microbispora oryzae]MBP2705331.1 ATP-binding cassette domain-containing protein [Microbispora oryzae]